jgi:hypothetical protein
MQPEARLRLLRIVEAENDAFRFASDCGENKQGDIFEPTEYSSWTCVCQTAKLPA